MKSTLKIQLSTALGFALACGWTGFARSAPQDPAVVDLASVLALHGEKVEEVTGTVVATVPDDGIGWQHGLFADTGVMVAGSLGITAGGDRSTRRSGQALAFTPGFPGIEAVHVASCRGGRCAPLATDAAGPSAVTFASETGLVKATTFSDLCTGEARSCEIFMPSWALSKLLTSADATLPRFPPLLLVAATAKTLVLVDAATGLEWLSFALPTTGEAKALGALHSAAFAPGGRLVLGFENAGMSLDFKQDLGIVATRSGSLLLSSTGLGSGTLAQVEPVFDGERLGGKAARFLAMGPDFAVTSNGVVHFSTSHKTGYRLIGTLESGDHWDQAAWVPSLNSEAAAKILVKESSGAASIVTLSFKPKIHGTTTWQSPPQAQGLGWVLAGRLAVESYGPGSFVFAGKDSATRGVTSAGSAELLVERASSAVKDAGSAGSLCEWTLQPVTGGDDPGAAERGLVRDDCKSKVTFGVIDAAGSLGVVSFFGGKARFQVWWANPAP